MRTCFTYASHWNPSVNLGVARIALLNLLHARSHKGQMIFRYDNMARHAPVSKVHDLLTWAGINYDQGPYYTSQNKKDYQQAVDKLLAADYAYHDFATPEEIIAEREATKEKPYLYSRKWAAKDEVDRARFKKEGRKSVVRMKMPRKEYIVSYRDMIMEDRRYDMSKEPDHILQRADGTFTEYITTAVDYGKFKIDYVFADHKHLELMPTLLYLQKPECINLSPSPTYAHVPYLTEPDGNRRFTPKRLKRHLDCEAFLQMYEHGCRIAGSFGTNITRDVFHPALLNFYKRSGFIPGAILHYLWASVSDPASPLRGCNPTTMRELVADYHITKIAKKAVPFEPVQIMRLQKAYMQHLPKLEKCWFVNEFLRKAGLSSFWTPKRAFYDTHFDPPPACLSQTVEKLKDELVLGGDIVFLTDHFAPGLKKEVSRVHRIRRITAPPLNTNGLLESVIATTEAANSESEKQFADLDDLVDTAEEALDGHAAFLANKVDTSEDEMGTDGQPIYDNEGPVCI